MARIFLTHVPDMLRNYYGERAVAALRELGEVRINDTGRVLDADTLAAWADNALDPGELAAAEAHAADCARWES